MQVIIDKIKNNSYCYNTSESYNPLISLKLVEKKILDHTRYKYCYATVYGKECAIYGFNQQKFTNE